MAELLKLKSAYKDLTGADYKPNTSQASGNTNSTMPVATENSELDQRIAHQGSKVRQLKSEKADKVREKYIRYVLF